MSAWPRSFFGRNLLLIIGMFFVGQMVSWVLFVALVQRPRIEHFAPVVSTQLATLRLALQDRDADARRHLLAALQQQSGKALRVSTQAPAAMAQPPQWLVRWFFGQLRQQLAPGETLAWQSVPVAMLWVRLPLARQEYWVGFDAQGFVLEVEDAALAILAVSVALALLGSWLIQTSLLRPLHALERAALRVGGGVEQGQTEGNAHADDLGNSAATVRVDAPMPLELARVARSFNTMAARLEARDRERALMLAGISHDLRTPLTNLWLGVEMLRGQADADLLARMTRSIETSNHIIGQFIDFARDAAAEAPQRCDPGSLAHAVAGEVLGGAARIELHADAQQACALRPLAVRRMLTNLLENARRHGRAPVHVRFKRLSEMLQIEVLDHGPGVPTEALATLTLPFVRLDGAAAVAGSTGLGLAIVERLARAHGGSLQLSNQPQGGLRACLQLHAPPVL